MKTEEQIKEEIYKVQEKINAIVTSIEMSPGPAFVRERSRLNRDLGNEYKRMATLEWVLMK